MKLIDSHAHLTAEQITDPDALIARAKEAQIEAIINICTDQKSLEKGLILSQKYPFIFNAGATTPHDVAIEGEKMFPIFAYHAKQKKLIAIGETGLDYHYLHSPKETQIHFLKKYLQLATVCQLPVIFHCREAFADLFAICDAEFQGSAVLHCFTGTMQEAEQVLKRGWYLSISGIVTFKKSHKLREIARQIPLNRLLIETDTPYLAPQKHRGKLNEPSYIIETAALIAQEKQITLQDLASATYNNSQDFFNLNQYNIS